jgi:hypothetical protein
MSDSNKEQREEEAQPGTETNPLRATGPIVEIAKRVKSGKWTTLDLDTLADYVLSKSSAVEMPEPLLTTDWLVWFANSRPDAEVGKLASELLAWRQWAEAVRKDSDAK